MFWRAKVRNKYFFVDKNKSFKKMVEIAIK